MSASRHVYRQLLRLCPPDLRAEFGEEMTTMFLAELARARGLARMRVWLRAVADVTRHGVGARRDSWLRVRGASSYTEYESGSYWMDTWRYDLRHAVRTMCRQPATTAIVVLTLALAIGANTAVFSAVHAALLQPLPYADPDRLVQIYEKRPAEGTFANFVSPADYVDWAAKGQGFNGMAAYAESAADLTGEGEPERFVVAGVTTSFFDVFGVRLALGRSFAPGEDQEGRNRVIVIDHALWRQRFGADPRAIGKTVILNDLPHEIIGVLPPQVRFPFGEPRIFAPLLALAGTEPLPRAVHYLNVYARLKSGVAIEQARAEMDRIGADLERQYPDLNRGHGPYVTPLAPEMVKGVRSMLLVLLTAVAFILVIACINVTNLLLAKAAGRRREVAVRAAIGAGRARLVRQVLVETCVLALAGGVAGAVIAYWGVQLLATQMPPAVRPEQSIVFTLPVVLFTAALCLAAGLLAGALPAWQVLRDDLAAALQQGGRSPVSLRRSLRFGLIVAEIALTSLVLVGAGLTLRSFQQVLLQPTGFSTDQRLTFVVRLPRARYTTPDAFDGFYANLEERLAAEPTVRRVGATSSLPLSGMSDMRNGIDVEGYERGEEDPPTRAHLRAITPGYIPAAGMRLTRGRAFDETDRTGPHVAIVNETMARRYWPGRSAIGGRVRLRLPEQEWREVIGVVADVKHWGLDASVNPEIYMPYEQFQQQELAFIVETAAEPASLTPGVLRHLRELDANLPLSNVRTFNAVAARSVEQRRFTMMLLASLAVLALILAAGGIYGVMAHLVSLRTPELGVRLTLGASPAAVMRGILEEGALQAALGLALGLGASVALMQGLRTILFGVEPTDPLTLLVVGAVLMLMALLAVAAPALRAMRIDPLTALRN